MSIVSLESTDEKNVSASILNFLTAYGVISLLSKCGGTKLRGFLSKLCSLTRSPMSSAWGASICRTSLGRFMTAFQRTPTIASS